MFTFEQSDYTQYSEIRADYLCSIDAPTIDERNELADIFDWYALLDSSEVQS